MIFSLTTLFMFSAFMVTLHSEPPSVDVQWVCVMLRNCFRSTANCPKMAGWIHQQRPVFLFFVLLSSVYTFPNLFELQIYSSSLAPHLSPPSPAHTSTLDSSINCCLYGWMKKKKPIFFLFQALIYAVVRCERVCGAVSDAGTENREKRIVKRRMHSPQWHENRFQCVILWWLCCRIVVRCHRPMRMVARVSLTMWKCVEWDDNCSNVVGFLGGFFS